MDSAGQGRGCRHSRSPPPEPLASLPTFPLPFLPLDLGWNGHISQHCASFLETLLGHWRALPTGMNSSKWLEVLSLHTLPSPPQTPQSPQFLASDYRIEHTKVWCLWFCLDKFQDVSCTSKFPMGSGWNCTLPCLTSLSPLPTSGINHLHIIPSPEMSLWWTCPKKIWKLLKTFLVYKAA